MRCWVLTLTVCALATVSALTDYTEADLDLVLPSFPPVPKRDQKMLHVEEEEDSEWAPRSERTFKASSMPRFVNDRGQMTAFQEDDAEDATLEFGGDESETMQVTPRPVAEEEEADSDEQSARYFGQSPAYLEQRSGLRRVRGGMSADAISDPSQLPPVPQAINRYDTEPLPPPPAGMGSLAAMAAARQAGASDELFTPIPPVERKYGSQPVEALSANPNAYAYANARQPYLPYQYPVQPQAFAQPAPLSAPGALGAVLHDPYSNSMAGVRMGQDLQQSEYQTYSQHNWPSAVAPPAQYYLPPDVVV